MRLEVQILLAIALDLILGDPRILPHPVTGIAKLARISENVFRRLVPWPRLAGATTAITVIGITVTCAWLLLFFAGKLHPLIVDVVSIVVLYTCLAARDLDNHARAVLRSLAAGDLGAARYRVSMLVGRDIDQMTEEDVARATVESVAENTSDGVIAPLLYAIAFGPLGAIAYKAVNTLDSLFGYKNDKCLKFGWASARLDDLLNIVPARVTGACMVLAAPFLRLDVRGAWRVLIRDSRRHPSPNSGCPEAAMAGALGVRLGGVNCYGGRAEMRPTLGDPVTMLSNFHIKSALRIMWGAIGIAAILSLGLRFCFTEALFVYGGTLL